MKSLNHRVAAFLVGAGLVLGGVAAAQPAAADVTPGTITLYGQGGTNGTPLTSGSVDTFPMFWGIKIDQACPAGFTNGSNTFAWQNGVNMGGLATARTPALGTTYGPTGLTGAPMNMSELNNTGAQLNYVSNKALASLTTPLQPGAWEIRVYCNANSFQDPNYVTDKYFVLPMTLSADGQTWSVYSAPQTEDTTVSLTAAAQPDDTAVLTATVKGENGATATGAVGTVTFREGTAVVGTGAVTNGVATVTTGVLSGGVHQFTATFDSTDEVYGDSPASSPASVTIQPDFGGIGTTTVTVEVGTGYGALTLTGVPAQVDLGEALPNAGNTALEASENLGQVTVTDTRQLDAPDWSLTGQSSNFASDEHQINARYFGWTPVKVSGPGTAGPAVSPNAPDGLNSVRLLGSGAVTDGAPTSVFDAELLLRAPMNTPAGEYSATLTLTLA